MIAIYMKFGFSFAALDKFIFVFILLLLAYIDLDTFCLPHSLLAMLFFWGFSSTSIYYFYPEWWHNHQGLQIFSSLILPHTLFFSVKNHVLGMLFGFLSFFLVNVAATFFLRKSGRLSKEQWAMGFGDPLLLAALGLFVGLSHLLLIIFLGSFLGAIFGIVNKFQARESPASDIAEGAIPYGPFLAIAGIYVSLF